MAPAYSRPASLMAPASPSSHASGGSHPAPSPSSHASGGSHPAPSPSFHASGSSHPASSPMAPASSSSHASDGSDTASLRSSHASHGSSPVSLPISSLLKKDVEEVVRSVDEVRRIIKYADPAVELRIHLAPNTSLAEAHKLWELVSTVEGGGYGELTNPDLLSNKEEALRFIQTRLERLRRLKRLLDRKHAKVVAEVANLERVIQEGGPGVSEGYEPHCYRGPAVAIDVDQDIQEEMEYHIASVQAFFLQTTPGSPIDAASLQRCLEQEEDEQRDLAQFNADYLQLKATSLQVMRDHLLQGIEQLHNRYINGPSFLGAGNAEFVRFKEINMFPQEAP